MRRPMKPKRKSLISLLLVAIINCILQSPAVQAACFAIFYNVQGSETSRSPCEMPFTYRGFIPAGETTVLVSETFTTCPAQQEYPPYASSEAESMADGPGGEAVWCATVADYDSTDHATQNEWTYCWCDGFPDPTATPSAHPSLSPTTATPSAYPSLPPTTRTPTTTPTSAPSLVPTSKAPTTAGPTGEPSMSPTRSPVPQGQTATPTTTKVTNGPSLQSVPPTAAPSLSVAPSVSPVGTVPTTSSPSGLVPTHSAVTVSPSEPPSLQPTVDETVPTSAPITQIPAPTATRAPSTGPSRPVPSTSPAVANPTVAPSVSPVNASPSQRPSNNPAATFPTITPSASPTVTTLDPSSNPTGTVPTLTPSASPTAPTLSPSSSPVGLTPTITPSASPTVPTLNPSNNPTGVVPTISPSASPGVASSPSTNHPSVSSNPNVPSTAPTTSTGGTPAPSGTINKPPTGSPGGDPPTASGGSPTAIPATTPTAAPTTGPTGTIPTDSSAEQYPTLGPSTTPQPSSALQTIESVRGIDLFDRSVAAQIWALKAHISQVLAHGALDALADRGHALVDGAKLTATWVLNDTTSATQAWEYTLNASTLVVGNAALSSSSSSSSSFAAVSPHRAAVPQTETSVRMRQVVEPSGGTGRDLETQVTDKRFLTNETVALVACGAPNNDFEVVAFTLVQLRLNNITTNTNTAADVVRLTVKIAYTVITTDASFPSLNFTPSTLRIIRESLWASLALDAAATTSLIENRAEIVRCVEASREEAIDSLMRLTRSFLSGRGGDHTTRDSFCDVALTHVLGGHGSHFGEAAMVDPVPLTCAWHLASLLGEAVTTCSCWEALARATMKPGPVCLWRLRSIVETVAAGVQGCAWAAEIAR